MMNFLNDDFLLETRQAVRLYHEYAEHLPIFDYHCHLPPDQIAGDTRFSNLAQAWLAGDHYKWRAMRTNGVPERLCSGNADDREKFMAWAATVPYTIGNPLYHWTHLELRRLFGITEKLDGETAGKIYERANKLLADANFSVRALMRRMNVTAVCTTDDPADSLEYHAQIRADRGFPIMVLPAFRPDKAMQADDPARFNEYVSRLETVCAKDINNFAELLAALKMRHDFFHAAGCRVSDHALEAMTVFDEGGADAEKIFNKVRSGERPSSHEATAFRQAILAECGKMDHEKGWVMQLHIGALRNVNSRMFSRLGADSGFDAINDRPLAAGVARFLNLLDRQERLPKTILFSLNAKDNDVLASLLGCFQGGGVPGKIQLGPAWWFNDHKEGMELHLKALASLGLLGRFVGMLTDSRSFLSYPRHEYFRRILCNLIGGWAAAGEIPSDMRFLGKIVRGICYENARAYFGIDPEGNGV